VTIRPADRGIRLILLDIEGTTTPLAFVRDVLFPYAHERVGRWLRVDSAPEARESILDALAREHAAGAGGGEALPVWLDDSTATRLDSAETYARWLMDRDAKSPALKRLQGLIWEDGYRAGVLRGDVFPDVPRALRRWRDAGIETAIYSSGSELAQRRLFESTPYGDFTTAIVAFFDTSVGPKVEADSYTRIAEALGCRPSTMLFVSDVVRELDAATAAGCQAVLSVRPGNRPQPDTSRFESITTFDDIA
jgi:2,3-diketo-5-methylthio-1-phosphopentane phosphatase